MDDSGDLGRFVKAQDRDYARALAEIRQGRKESHWIWYIFPQLRGLGYSRNASYYGIAGRPEAEAYLQHPVLGPRLIEISRALLALPGNDANEIMGDPDDMKLHSSMTLFSMVKGADKVFEQVLAKFFAGDKDERTVDMLDAAR